MKLDKDGDNYYITKKVPFKPHLIDTTIIDLSLEFAYEMAFGLGHHRAHRTGGQDMRRPIEIFGNTFQGKVAEGVFYKYLNQNNIPCDAVDYSIHGKGVWDDSDILCRGKKISIKSAAFFSNLLLLESEDWDANGNYIPNRNTNESADYYDYFVLIRIKPNTKALFKDSGSKQALFNTIKSYQWYYDIPGCFSHKTLKYIIDEGYVLPKNSLLNGKIKMDAENYYIQTGSLKPITELINNLKN